MGQAEAPVTPAAPAGAVVVDTGAPAGSVTVKPPPTPVVLPFLSIRLPTNPGQWAGLVITLSGVILLIYQGQGELAAGLFGLLLNQLGIQGQYTAIAMSAFVAAQQSAKTAHTTEVIKDAVADIQNNPSQPGTPGWMDNQPPTVH